MLLKLGFYCFTCSAILNWTLFISFSLSHNTKQWLEILNLQIETLLEFKKCNEYRNYWLLFSAPWICLRFALDFSDLELLDIDLSDAD